MIASDHIFTGPSFLTIEIGLTSVLLALALCWPQTGANFFGRAGRTLRNLARRKRLCIAAVGATAGLVRLAVLPLSPVPRPFVSDEFSYLLASETFASARLTNPAHPMWAHLESFHIDMKPTYMSMYFPAQGMLLATGQILAGNPWFGVWVSCILMCAAICWMLQGWLPPVWALLGGVLAVLRLALFSYWMDSYWGGALPALAGALVLGSVPRLCRSFRSRDLFWMALGMTLLAISRPYEGLLVCVPAVAAVAWSLWRKPLPPASVILMRVAPALSLLIATVAFMAYYDFCVFGKMSTPPYKVNRDTYASAPHFVFQSARPEPVYRYKTMRDFYVGLELRWFEDMQTGRGFLRKTLRKAGMAGFFYFGAALLLPLAVLPKVVFDRRIRFLVVVGLVFAVGLALETWLLPHYAAPFTAGIYAILLQCMRHLGARRRGHSPGLFIVRATPVLCVALALVRVSAGPLHISLPGAKMLTAYGSAPAGLAREHVLEELENLPGGQLAIVRYRPDHDTYEEWVYNHADIDRSKVVWARDMDAAGNAELLSYYADRKAWLVEPDSDPPTVSRYPGNGVLHLKPGFSLVSAAQLVSVKP
jgi:hypothetical protein